PPPQPRPAPAPAPPAITVTTNDASGAPGYLFVTPGLSAADARLVAQLGGANTAAAPAHAPAATGAPLIADKAGRPVWFHPLPADRTAANLQVQTYRGQPVLTWWEGESQGGHGVGDAYVADASYRIVAHLALPAGLRADVHEFRLTPDGRALLTAYREVPRDLSAVGGPKDGRVWDSVAVVVDVATNTPLLQWSALQHVPISDSYLTPSGPNTFDAFHMNSIAPAPNGDLLISLRHTSTVYDVDGRTGQIRWQLGGRRSSFRQPGVEFAFQHDAEFADADTIRLFDNDANGLRNGQGAPESSVEWIHVDPGSKIASLVRRQPHPGSPVVTAAMGNAQPLPNGDTLIGWGVAGRVSEVTPAGRLVYDATMPSTYRAYLCPWRGAPPGPPTVTIDAAANPPAAHASWNGATDVATWQLLRDDSGTSTVVATVPWNGLDTAIGLDAGHRPTGTYRVRALDAAGRVIADSPATQA
ncbi:arylsulfotransferase family protein, partial [Mycolicibacterium madagascariense]